MYSILFLLTFTSQMTRRTIDHLFIYVFSVEMTQWLRIAVFLRPMCIPSPHGDPQPSIISIPGNPVSSSDLYRQCTHRLHYSHYTHTWRPDIYTYKINITASLFLNILFLEIHFCISNIQSIDSNSVSS